MNNRKGNSPQRECNVFFLESLCEAIDDHAFSVILSGVEGQKKLLRVYSFPLKSKSLQHEETSSL